MRILSGRSLAGMFCLSALSVGSAASAQFGATPQIGLLAAAPGREDQIPSQVLEEPAPMRLPAIKPDTAPDGPPLPASPEPQPDAAANNWTSESSGDWGQCPVSSDSCQTDCGCDSVWFASAAGLIMSRNHSNNYWTTYDTNNASRQLLNSNDAAAGWGGGDEIRLGRRFGCDQAIEVTWWQLPSFNGQAELRSNATPGLLSTPLDVGLVTFNGVDAGDYFDQAHAHRIERRDSVLNLELNWWKYSLNTNDRLRVSCLAGVRWFQFDERFMFSSLSGGGGTVPAANNFGDNGGSREATIDIKTTNNLVGFQIGMQADYQVTGRWSLYCTPKFGVYGNLMDQTASVYTGSGVYAVAAPIGGAPSIYAVNGTKSDIAILAQLDLGMKWQITERWKATAAYRILAANGVALSDQQMPAMLVDYGHFQDIQSNGSLIMHGVVAGVEYSF